jgi:DNA-binding transcriptional MerR regulator
METSEMAIGELADAAGLSRRAIRFYVQQGLLPPPLGRGRGRHYDATHLAVLRRIQELQQAGHSLDAIRKILQGRASPAPSPSTRPTPSGGNGEPRARPTLSAQLWTRLRLMEGVELHFDAAKFHPEVEGLLALRQAAREVFGRDQEDS